MDSSSQLPLFYKAFLLLCLLPQGAAVFNCTRTWCNNGGVCNPMGDCTCVGTIYAGYDCSQDQRHIMHGQCLSHNPCKNGGTCYDSAPPGSTGSAFCYCPYEFYGVHCEFATVHNECYNDHMIVNVNPHGRLTRVGLQHNNVFCELQPVSSQVHFSLDPVRSLWQGYAATLPFHGPTQCGATAKALTMGAEMTYTYDVIVRYGSRPELDEIISYSCTVPYMAGAVAGPTAVLFSVADPQGLPVNTPKVGSTITVTFKVDPTSIFTDVAVRACTVTNTMRTVSKNVVTNSCPVSPFGTNLVKQGEKHVLTLRMHTFGHDPSLTFDCLVKVCTIADHTCQHLPVCPAVSPSGALATSISSMTSDILGLLGMPPASGGGTGSGSLSSLLGGSLNDLLGPSPGGTASSMSTTGTGDLTSSLTNLLGAGSLNDLLLSPGGSTAGATVGRKRRRRDVSGDVTDDENVVMTPRRRT